MVISMEQDSRQYEDSLTNERFFASGTKNQFDIINEAIERAEAIVSAGKDVLNPAFETLKSMANKTVLVLPDRPKRVPLEIKDEEKGSHRPKKSYSSKQ